jgi:hypothetical protein
MDNPAQVPQKDRRSKCQKLPGIFGLLLPTLEPFQFRASGISATAVKALTTRFIYNKNCRNPANPAITDYHRFKITIGSQLVKSEAGSAYAIKVIDMLPLNEPTTEKELYIATAKMLGQTNVLLEEGIDPDQPLSIGEKLADTLADPSSKITTTIKAPPPEGPAPQVTNVSPVAKQPDPPVTKPAAKTTISSDDI